MPIKQLFPKIAEKLAEQPTSLDTPANFIKNRLEAAIKSKAAQNLAQSIGEVIPENIKQGGSDVMQAVGGITEALNAPRQQFIDKSAEQLDLSRRGDPEFRQQAKAALDFALPDATSLTLDAGKVLRAAPEAKNLGKVIMAPEAKRGFGKVFNPVGGQTAASAIHQERLRELMDRKLAEEAAKREKAEALKDIFNKMQQEVVVEPMSQNAPRSTLVKP